MTEQKNKEKSLPMAELQAESDLGPASRPRKRVYVGLICGTSLVICLITLLAWSVPYIGLGNIHPAVPYITGFFTLLILAFVAWATIGLVLQVMTGRLLWGTRRVRGLSVKLFLPLMEFFGRIVRIPPIEVRRSFIQVNNELVGNMGKKFKPEQILLLLPHCIQWSGCSIRVSNRLERCKRCGQCDISALLELTEKYGISLAVATGGTIARRIVVEKRPKMILAVACERDLSSGIQDTYPLPVYGVLNQRPHGPCMDTRVELEDVEAAIRKFLAEPPGLAGQKPAAAGPQPGV